MIGSTAVGAIGAGSGTYSAVVANREKTGSWDGSFSAALDGAASGFQTGTLAGGFIGMPFGAVSYGTSYLTGQMMNPNSPLYRGTREPGSITAGAKLVETSNGKKNGGESSVSNIKSGLLKMDLQYFAKKDLKQISDVANQIGVNRTDFGNFIHEVEADLGRKANENFSYQELIELAKEIKGK